jgi:hypothetical protein
VSRSGRSIADQLMACLRSGTTLDLIPEVPAHGLVQEARMRSWDERHDLDADVVRDLLLGRPSHSADPRGLRVRGVRIRGRLDLDLVTSPGPLEIHDSFLDEGLSADQARFPTLELVGCRISNTAEIALDLDRVQVDGSLYLNRSHVTASTHHGGVRMIDARIGGNLFCGGATLLNTDGPAMLAHGLRTERDLFLDPGFTAEGRGELGAIGMTDARIGARIHLTGAVLRNPIGPALDLDGLQATRDVHLDAGFSAEGATDSGALRLSGARIGGRLILTAATVRNRTGPAIIADNMQVDRELALDGGAVVDGSGPRGAVRLTGARVGGTLDLTRATITSHSSPQDRWMIDGLCYGQVPRLAMGRAVDNRSAWLDLLRTATPAYAAQPYQQLAAAFRAEGHDSDVRAILIAQRRDHIARGGLALSDRWWARATGVLLGYGYQPWRALLYLAAVLAISVALAVGLGANGALALTPTAANPTQPCALIDMIGRGLDLGTPFLPKTSSPTCAATTTATGTVLTISTWVLQLAAWSLAALFVAGFTGIVRKT